MGRLIFKELSKKEFKKNRNVVISKATGNNGKLIGYSIAEQLVVDEDGKKTEMFLRGGLGIVSIEGLEKLKDAIEEAISNIKDKDNEEWDNK